MHIGPLELVIILLIIVVLFGLGRVGKVAGELGKGLASFRKGLKGDEAEPQKPEDLPDDALNETKPLEATQPPTIVQGANIQGNVDTKGGDFVGRDKIVHNVQPLPVGDNTLPVFVSSLEAHTAEREAVGKALDKTLNLFSRTKTDFTVSGLRSPEDVKQGLGKRTYFILFASSAPGDSQIEENRLARKACLGKRLLLAPAGQVRAAAKALGEPQKEFIVYTPEQDLAELIFEKLVRLETENAGKNGNPHNLSRDALLVLAGLGGGLGLGMLLEPLKNLIEQMTPDIAPPQGPEQPAQPRPQASPKVERRLPYEPKTVYVDAGEFWMGSNDWDKDAYDYEKPRHKVYLDAYRIGRYPVTAAEFKRFVEQTGHRTTAEKDSESSYTWRTPRGKGSDLVGKEMHPVCQVSWEDAVAYCRWLSKVTGRNYSLPTEAQWEKAARGIDGRRFPWGNDDPDRSRCNIANWFEGTTPVGHFSPYGDSLYGCADMAGNVWEWCADWWDEQYYSASPLRNPRGPASGSTHVLRGGAWINNRWDARCACRIRLDPVDFGNNVGFRLVLSLADSGF